RAFPLFQLATRRLSRAAGSLPGVDVIVVGESGYGGLFPGAVLVAQRGKTFGGRFQDAFEDVRAAGDSEVVAVPIAVPDLGTAQIATAFDRLSTNDVVIGPSPDGGVYLVGTRVAARPLFRGVPWQTAGVFLALLRNAREAVVLGSLLDVDGYSD